MFFHPRNLKSENDNPWFKPWLIILLHTQSIMGAIVGSQCLEYFGYITLISRQIMCLINYFLQGQAQVAASSAQGYLLIPGGPGASDLYR